jgi:hypothetical protein
MRISDHIGQAAHLKPIGITSSRKARLTRAFLPPKRSTRRTQIDHLKWNQNLNVSPASG